MEFQRKVWPFYPPDACAVDHLAGARTDPSRRAHMHTSPLRSRIAAPRTSWRALPSVHNDMHCKKVNTGPACTEYRAVLMPRTGTGAAGKFFRGVSTSQLFAGVGGGQGVFGRDAGIDDLAGRRLIVDNIDTTLAGDGNDAVLVTKVKAPREPHVSCRPVRSTRFERRDEAKARESSANSSACVSAGARTPALKPCTRVQSRCTPSGAKLL